MPTKIICDTHVLLFWANEPDRLTVRAEKTLDENREKGILPVLTLPSGRSPSFMRGEG